MPFSVRLNGSDRSVSILRPAGRLPVSGNANAMRTRGFRTPQSRGRGAISAERRRPNSAPRRMCASAPLDRNEIGKEGIWNGQRQKSQERTGCALSMGRLCSAQSLEGGGRVGCVSCPLRRVLVRGKGTIRRSVHDSGRGVADRIRSAQRAVSVAGRRYRPYRLPGEERAYLGSGGAVGNLGTPVAGEWFT